MNTESQIRAIEQRVTAIMSSDPENFLVEVKIKPGNNIKVFIDSDKGISIDKLTQYNRSLYKQIEESGIFYSDDFSLEVSSPGLDEPLKLHRQYIKNLGRFVEILLKDGIKIEGKLTAVSDTEIGVEESKGNKKKPVTILHQVPYNDIKTTKIQIKF
jgi:ribosome maturation factor RimP